MRGLVREVIRLITPPLPAVSRPSNTTMMRAPVAWTQVCRRVSSTWSFASSFSNSLGFILADAAFGSATLCFCCLSFAMWQRSLPLLETEHGKGAMILQAAVVAAAETGALDKCNGWNRKRVEALDRLRGHPR